MQFLNSRSSLTARLSPRLSSVVVAPAFVLATFALVVSAASVAHAQNIVTNPGFEASSSFPPTGWTTGGGGTNVSFNTFANSGARSVLFSSSNGLNNTLSQTLTTVAGRQYTFSYFLWNGTAGSDFFSSSFGGSVVELLNPSTTTFGFTQRSFTVTASSTSTVIEFAARDAPSGFFLDDISVTPFAVTAPEPGSIALALPLLVGTGLVFAWRKRTT